MPNNVRCPALLPKYPSKLAGLGWSVRLLSLVNQQSYIHIWIIVYVCSGDRRRRSNQFPVTGFARVRMDPGRRSAPAAICAQLGYNSVCVMEERQDNASARVERSLEISLREQIADLFVSIDYNSYVEGRIKINASLELESRVEPDMELKSGVRSFHNKKKL
ncbi:hypothetical protein EVAR_46649_1 [Eumeta japonica]|uniref:Uncharacterized protein n=1 Tax=Eumeta variegata TaxID=151549 RepID=A0A4C1WIQ3_EUMVA|nr:hypothetical protein EVAR_46649_1 [Eumeta japonica]